MDDKKKKYIIIGIGIAAIVLATILTMKPKKDASTKKPVSSVVETEKPESTSTPDSTNDSNTGNTVNVPTMEEWNKMTTDEQQEALNAMDPDTRQTFIEENNLVDDGDEAGQSVDVTNGVNYNGDSNTLRTAITGKDSRSVWGNIRDSIFKQRDLQYDYSESAKLEDEFYFHSNTGDPNITYYSGKTMTARSINFNGYEVPTNTWVDYQALITVDSNGYTLHYLGIYPDGGGDANFLVLLNDGTISDTDVKTYIEKGRYDLNNYDWENDPLKIGINKEYDD